MAASRVIRWDTDMLIELLNGNADALTFFKQSTSPVYFSAISYAELIRGAANKAAMAKIKIALLPFVQLDIDSETTEEFCRLIDDYSLSHGIQIPDALIAATALPTTWSCPPATTGTSGS